MHAESRVWIASRLVWSNHAKTELLSHRSRLKMADKMEGVLMGGSLVDPSKYPVPIET